MPIKSNERGIRIILTADQRADLGERIGANREPLGGESIKDVLPRHYPDAEIFIVVGYDPGGKRYIRDASFSRDAALQALKTEKERMKEKPPMGIAALAHAYELMNGTAIDIDGGLGRSSSALMELDEVEIWMVYRGLRQELSNAESAQHVR